MSVRLIAALLAMELRSNRKALLVDLKKIALSIVKNPGVRKAALALLAALAAAAGASRLGCHDLTPKQQARLDKFECQVRAVAPLVEPIYDAADLVLKLRSGEASLGQVLKTLEAGEPEVRELLARLEACEGEPEAEPAALVPASW